MSNWMTSKGGKPGASHASLGVPPKSKLPVKITLPMRVPGIIGRRGRRARTLEGMPHMPMPSPPTPGKG